MNIGKTIKICRKQRGLTQAQLAEQAKISKSHLCLMENNNREPSLKSLESISKALKIPLNILIFLSARPDQLKDMDETYIEILSERIMELMNSETTHSNT